MVSVSFDPTEGIIKMDLVAATPDDARRFSRAIIGYAEEMVDTLADPIREAALRDAERNLSDAETSLKNAQLAEAEVRKTLDTFSVEGEVSAELSIIAGMETELEALRGRLQNLRRVTSESDPRVERIRNQVETLESQITERRKNVTGGDRPGRGSLADINAELARAQVDVQAAMAIFTAALETREIARADSAKQHRYLSVVVQPSVPDEANYPQKWKQTGLAFLIFLGIYIVASLTISLIREQASI
jgi:capsular polysaccharide transport system permease protein